MNEIVSYEQAPKMDLAYFNQVCDIAYKSKCYGSIAKETMLNLCMTAHDLGIPISKALNGGFHIVQGKIVMSAGLMNDMIRKAGHSLNIELLDTKCSITGRRKDNGDSIKIEYSMKDAEVAGLANSPTWKKHPKDMLYNRAMTKVGRMLFSDVIGNAYSEDESHEIQNIPASKRPDIDPYDPNTIEVENNIPKIEMQKPDTEFIPLERLHLAMDVMGCKCSLENLREFVSQVALAHEKSDQAVIGNAMKNDDRIASFIKSYEIYSHASNPE
jgi:hypothetical protein